MKERALSRAEFKLMDFRAQAPARKNRGHLAGDRNALGPSHGAAPDWCGVIGNGTGHSFGKIGVVSVKGQERSHGPEEVLKVFSLGFVTASGIGFLLLGETHRGSFCIEIGSNTFNGRCPCPYAP